MDDKTDEVNCKYKIAACKRVYKLNIFSGVFPTIKYIVFSLIFVFMCGLNLILKFRHSKSLKCNNVKRYNQDVYKRKDIARLRKTKDSAL